MAIDLQKKYGPLPLWVWVLGGAAVAAFLYLRYSSPGPTGDEEQVTGGILTQIVKGPRGPAGPAGRAGCRAGTRYNAQLKRCVPVSGPPGVRPPGGGPPSGTHPPCPKDRPHRVGNQCRRCVRGFYFSKRAHRCVRYNPRAQEPRPQVRATPTGGTQQGTGALAPAPPNRSMAPADARTGRPQSTQEAAR